MRLEERNEEEGGYLYTCYVDGVDRGLLEGQAGPVVQASRRVEDGIDPLHRLLHVIPVEDVRLPRGGRSAEGMNAAQS